MTIPNLNISMDIERAGAYGGYPEEDRLVIRLFAEDGFGDLCCVSENSIPIEDLMEVLRLANDAAD